MLTDCKGLVEALEPIEDINTSDEVDYVVYRAVNIYVFWFIVNAYRETLSVSVEQSVKNLQLQSGIE
jgi:hypothetical protein